MCFDDYSRSCMMGSFCPSLVRGTPGEAKRPECFRSPIRVRRIVFMNVLWFVPDPAARPFKERQPTAPPVNCPQSPGALPVNFEGEITFKESIPSPAQSLSSQQFNVFFHQSNPSTITHHQGYEDSRSVW